MNPVTTAPSHHPGFQQHLFDTSIILFDAETIPEPDSSIFGAEYWRSQNKLTGRATGRGTTYFFEHEHEQFALRRYRRGGFFANLLSDRYLFTGYQNSRACRELVLLKNMRQMGLPVPHPVAAMVTRTGLFYRADIITRKIPDSRDAHQLLCERELTRDIWQQIGRTIRLFHDRQIFHHDLNIRNIMLDGDGGVWLIDFDKCANKSGGRWKQKNLQRLRRSLSKERHRNAVFHWTERDWTFLIAGYESSGDPATHDEARQGREPGALPDSAALGTPAGEIRTTLS